MKYRIFFLISTVIIPGLIFASSPANVKQFNKTMDTRIEAIVNSIASPTIPSRTIILSEFSGHAGDEQGTHDFYEDIKSAIDSLSKVGGGVLLFTHSKGAKAFVKQTEIYRVKGPIILKSNIELRFQPNLKLYFEFSPANYLPDNKAILTRYESTSLYSFCPLIYAFNAENIAISFTGGNGAMPVIDGDGARWQKWMIQGDEKVQAKGLLIASSMVRSHLNDDDVPLAERICADTSYHFLRPALIQFIHCQKIKIDGVKLVNSPFWTVHPVFCTDMTFRNVIYDCQIFNNDGIDIESSSRVLVENVIFDNHDDNIVIKSGRDKEGRDGVLVKGTEYEQINSKYISNGRITAPTTDVVVRNCVFKGHNSVCVGSEIAGGANNIYVTDCYSPMSVKMGVYLKSTRSRGGVVSDIYVRNLSYQSITNDAICMIPNYDNDTTSAYPTVFKNVYINNIHVKESGNGIRIFGWEDALIQNVNISNVNVENVSSKSEDKIFLINQVKDVNLRRVFVNKKDVSGKYNKQEKNAYPPKQK